MWIKYNCIQGSWKCPAFKSNPTVHQIAYRQSFQLFPWDFKPHVPLSSLFVSCISVTCAIPHGLFLPRCALCILYCTPACSVSRLLRHDIANVATVSGFSAKSSLKLRTTDTAPRLPLIPSISVSVFPHSAHFNVTDCDYAAEWNASKCYRGYVEPSQVKTDLQPMLRDILLLNKSTAMTSSKTLCTQNSNLASSVELETRTAHFSG